MEYILIPLVCMLSGFAAASISFGYAIINMILLPLFLDVKYASLITLIACFYLFGSIVFENLVRQKIKLNPIFIILPVISMTVGRFIGVVLFTFLSSMQLIIILSVFMVLLNIYFFVLSNRIRIKKGKGSALITGFLSGLFGGMYSIGGPPIVVYYHSVEKDPIKYTTYVQLNFLIGALTTVSLHLAAGNFDIQVLKYGAIGTLGVVIGATAGYRLFKKINREKLSVIIRLAILILSIVLVVKTIIQILNS